MQVSPSANSKVTRAEREAQFKQRGTVIWFTGLSGAGKTTLSIALERALFERKAIVIRLDGEVVRSGLNSDLGYSAGDRKENIRRIGEVAKLMSENALVTIVAFISPFREDRDRIRNSLGEGRFVEVFVDCPLEVCEQRDTKGLYEKARKGEISDFTGISSPYEPPLNPEVHLHTDTQTVEECVQAIFDYLEQHPLSSS